MPFSTTKALEDFAFMMANEGRTVTHKVVVRTLDGDGKETAVPTYTSTSINAVLQDVTSRDRQNFAAIENLIVHRKAFVKASTSIAPDDLIIVAAGTEEYEVVAIKKHEVSGTEIFTTAFLRMKT